MNKNLVVIIAIIVFILIIGGVYMSINDEKNEMIIGNIEQGEEMMTEGEGVEEKEAMMEEVEKNETMVEAGSYEAYAPEKIAQASSEKDVVLFFRASWCPTCRAVDADIKAKRVQIPASLTILDVDYDNSTALKQEYKVTYQHTFVQVDKEGSLIKKWTGSPTLAAVIAEIK